MRPGWHEYFLGIAQAVAARADCTRRKVGAVIVDTDHRVIATGYNGSAPGKPGCLEGACPRGRHVMVKVHLFDDEYEKLCLCGGQWPCEYAVEPGSSYDTGPGTCISCHAELNALLFARASVKDCTMYITEKPCDGCARAIEAAGISGVIHPGVLTPYV